MNDVVLPVLPFDLHWAVPAEHWEPVVSAAAGEVGLLIEAGPQTDLFVSPEGDPPTLNAPRLIGVPDPHFQLSALVDAEFAAAFDAGVLLLWATESVWAKLCFEYSPAGQPMVVSVVTRGHSDDANSFDVIGSSIWLRISSTSHGAYAFHAAPDGVHWQFIRHFALDPGDHVVQVGFEAQSPTGEGCRASFSQLRYLAEPLDDLRSGD
jgi:regulation of enolase protein 1 (concanavalin A-like superfamily)